jgi:hypothetical protein
LAVFFTWATTLATSARSVLCSIDISSIMRHFFPRMFFFRHNIIFVLFELTFLRQRIPIFD